MAPRTLSYDREVDERLKHYGATGATGSISDILVRREFDILGPSPLPPLPARLVSRTRISHTLACQPLTTHHPLLQVHALSEHGDRKALVQVQVRNSIPPPRTHAPSTPCWSTSSTHRQQLTPSTYPGWSSAQVVHIQRVRRSRRAVDKRSRALRVPWRARGGDDPECPPSHGSALRDRWWLPGGRP